MITVAEINTEVSEDMAELQKALDRVIKQLAAQSPEAQRIAGQMDVLRALQAKTAEEPKG